MAAFSSRRDVVGGERLYRISPASVFAAEVTVGRASRFGDNARWAILDSNQGPPPYQSGALTN
jgi:hypothetical protein